MAKRKLLAVLLGLIAFQLLFFPFNEKTFGLITIPFFGTLGFLLTIIAGHLVNFLAFKLPADKRRYIYAGATISLISAFASIFRASFIDRFLLTSLASFWWLVTFYLFVLPNINFGSFTEVLLMPLRLASTLPKSVSQLMRAFSKLSLEGTALNKSVSKIVIGLIITIPAAGFLLVLLLSADPIFGYYVNKFLNFDISLSEITIQLLWRTFFSAIALFTLLILVLTKIKNAFVSPATSIDQKNSHLLGPYLMLTATISVILALFLIVQFKYLGVSNLNDLTEFGIPTFSEYVRRGFVELILATGMVYTVSGVGLILHRRFKPGNLHFAVNSTLIILNIVLAAMAYRRVYLYVIEHGLTHMRIYGTMMLLVIVLFLITLFARYIVSNHKLYLVELLGASLIMFSFGIVNTDYLLARTAPPTVNKQVDINYLARLSADDPESWVAVYEDIQKDTHLLLEKESLSLDEKILILRSSWAINRIYESVAMLARKHGGSLEESVFDNNYYINNDHSALHFNVQEYLAYFKLHDEINFKELNGLKENLNERAMNLPTEGIPHDIYQFMGEW